MARCINYALRGNRRCLHIQGFQNIRFEFAAHRLHAGAVVFDRLAITINQVLVEIPARCTAGLLRQLSEHRIGIAATHRAPGEHGESYPIVDVTHCRGLALIAGLLEKIIGREADNFESLVPVLLIKRFESLELRRKSAVTGGVYDQQHLVLEVAAKINLVAGTKFLRLKVEQGTAAGKSAIGEQGERYCKQ